MKIFKKFATTLTLGLLLSGAIIGPQQKASADAGLTLGIIGTVLGGTALANSLFGCRNCGNSAPTTAFYPMPTMAMGGGGGCCGCGMAYDPCAPVYPSMVPPPPPAPAPQGGGCGGGCNVNVNVGNSYGQPQMQMPQQQMMPPQNVYYQRPVRGLW